MGNNLVEGRERGQWEEACVKREGWYLKTDSKYCISFFFPETTCIMALGMALPVVECETPAPKFHFSQKPHCLQMRSVLPQASGTSEWRMITLEKAFYLNYLLSLMDPKTYSMTNPLRTADFSILFFEKPLEMEIPKYLFSVVEHSE